MTLAARSLPVPLSPLNSTVDAGLDATFRISVLMVTSDWLLPTIRSKL